MIGIYKITNPKGKVYIGQSIRIEDRFKDYIKLRCKNQTKLLNSFNKYGVLDHVFEVLEECPESYLDELETWWKLFYNSVESGLNFSYWDFTPMRGRKHTKEAIDKIKKHHTGSKRSEKTKQLMSKNSGIKGKPRSNYQKQRTRETNTGRKHSEETKIKMGIPVLQYDLEGNFIREWNSSKEVERSLGIKGVSNCCSGWIKISGNYLWKYKIDNYPLKIEKYINPNKKPITQYSLNGEFVKHFDSLTEAIKLYGGSVGPCSLGTQKTAHGYQWFCFGNKFPDSVAPYVKAKQERTDEFKIKQGKPVIQYDLNGNIISEFATMKVAQDKTNITQYNISACCRGKQKTAGGYVWKFKNRNNF
jgi:group I intron endonuclease